MGMRWRACRWGVIGVAMSVFLVSLGGCDGEEGGEVPQRQTFEIGAEGVRYLYAQTDGEMTPVTAFEKVPLSARGATALWRSSSTFQQPEGEERYVANVLGAESGTEVTAELRSTDWMVDASRAGRAAAKLALGIRDASKQRAKWIEHKTWLWRVGSANPPLYIVGSSALVSIDGVEDLGPGVMRALEGAERVILPTPINRMTRKQLIRFALRSAEEPTVSEELSEEALTAVRGRLADEIPLGRMKRFRPEMVMMELVQDMDVSRYSDVASHAERLNRFNSSMVKRFEVAAKARDKEIDHLRSLDDALAEVGETVSYEHLQYVASHLDEVQVQLNQYKAAYEGRDVDRLREHAVDASFGLTPDAPGFEEMLASSSKAWMSKLMSSAKQGATVAVVPAVVMVVEGGVRDRLEDAGIEVTLLD